MSRPAREVQAARVSVIMRILRLERLRRGEPLLATGGRWPALLALCIAVAVVAASLFTAQIVVAAAGGPQGPAGTVLFLLAMQVTMIALTSVAAAMDGRTAWVRLALAPSAMGRRAMLEAVAGGIVLVGTYTLVVGGLRLTDLVTDLKPFIGLMRDPVWPLAVLAVSAGAPLSEEILFRGFLMPALARSRLRMRGAALLSTLAWTGLHAGYSAAGMVEVFLIGLYFCWLTWRSGSLWLPIVCHVVINSLTLALIAVLLLGR